MILSTTPIGAKSGRGKRLNERGDEAEAKLCQRGGERYWHKKSGDEPKEWRMATAVLA
jgi:hypothetical protein